MTPKLEQVPSHTSALGFAWLSKKSHPSISPENYLVIKFFALLIPLRLQLKQRCITAVQFQ